MARAPEPIRDRLVRHVTINGECWEWSGFRDPRGYGRVTIATGRADGANRLAHRVMFEIDNGPIPTGLLVCHRCDNPPCINPAHLFLGTAADNAADRMQKGRFVAWQTRLTHCKRGHEFTPENTYLNVSRGRRERNCRTCMSMHALNRKTRLQENVNGR